MIPLAFVCFDTWLKPLFSQVERHNLEPVQECYPYVVGLLGYIQTHRRN
jgi:hypothetical protein